MYVGGTLALLGASEQRPWLDLIDHVKGRDRTRDV
jgi:hypothetical protein